MSSNHLAPEWERQDAIIIVWPHLHSDWKSNLAVIEKTYLKISKHICKHQRLILVTYDYEHLLHIQQKLNSSSIDTYNISFVTIPTNDTWVRDYGPICINSNNEFTLLDFEFDAWGQKYDYKLDNAFNTKLSELLELNACYQHIEQVLEAGNIEINSRGELLCSNSCLKCKINTSFFDLYKLEKQFADWFEICKTYWIDAIQIIGDDTDGHIDTLARFCGDDIIVYSSIGDQNDANNEVLNKLNTQLNSIKKQSSNRFDLVPLPLPTPIFSSGNQLPASYTNFLITNDSVLVPIFNDKQDNYALKLFEELFPTREIIEIESSTLIQQFGGLHCATMQVPKGMLK